VCTKPLVAAAAAAGLLFSAASNFASALSKVHVIVFQLFVDDFINEIITHNPVYSATLQHTFLRE
jgi:anti-sigma factor RsiW